MEDLILQMKKITKEFPGVKALDDVCLDVKRGEIHALCGENGAGKSTLMKVLSGEHTDYSGKLIVDKKEHRFNGIKESEAAGIAIIHQELGLVSTMSVCENIFLSDEICRGGIIDWDAEYKKSRELLHKLELDINPTTRVGNLGVGQQQLVEIAKALKKDVKILVLDEPTAALPEKDSENLLRLMSGFRDNGMTIIFISHKLNEVMDVADTVTILRDGQTIISKKKTDFNTESLISNMVGRELTNRFEPREGKIGDVVLEVKDWSAYDAVNSRWVLKNINLNVRAGEIVGVAGMVGAGRTELAMSIFGALDQAITGKLILEGQERKLIKQPEEAIKNGVYYLTEDRKGLGLILNSDIAYNSTLASLDSITDHMLINKDKELELVHDMIDKLQIKTPSVLQRVKNLSGGNQQKVCIARALLTNPKVLILDEATRGIDIGAKNEIYKLMNQLVEQGIAVIMISSELPEILGMSDRVYVMREGIISGEFDNRSKSLTQDKIALAATGGSES
ncbi:MAG: sugar ABC transporter ATP-binding protein [Suipraeoptans sp.]